MLLALSRLWDTNTRAVRMSRIIHAIRQRAVIDDLAADRATEHYPNLVDVMRTDLQVTAAEVLKLACKYSEGGSHNEVRKNLLRFRNERLAHRQIGPSTITGADKSDEQIEEFYQDNATIIGKLLHLVSVPGYDPLTTAGAYKRYAFEFWAGARGENGRASTFRGNVCSLFKFCILQPCGKFRAQCGEILTARAPHPGPARPTPPRRRPPYCANRNPEIIWTPH
jgi:hypothetical protein